MKKAGLFCLLMTQCVAVSVAQRTSASISGTVRDASNAVLPGATVTVVNVDTGISRTMVTEEQGRYRALQLNPGQYEIRAELPGFKTSIQRGVILTVGQDAVLDLTLQVGEVSEEVVVRGDATMVQTTGNEIGGVGR